MSENGEFTMQTPAAVLAPKQQYLNLMMNSIYKFGEICASNDATRVRQERVSMLVRMIISYIPNPAERKRLTALRSGKIKEAKKINDIEIMREEIFNVDCFVVGEIMELMDSILAVVERQTVIGTVASKVNGLEEEYYPTGFTMPTIEGEE